MFGKKYYVLISHASSGRTKLLLNSSALRSNRKIVVAHSEWQKEEIDCIQSFVELSFKYMK